MSTLRSEFSLASKTSVNLSSSLPYSTEVSPYLRHVVARVDLVVGRDYHFLVPGKMQHLSIFSAPQ